LIYQVILKKTTVSLSAVMLVLNNSLLANFEFEYLKNNVIKVRFQMFIN
jgi:hypothetical protein